MQLPPASVMANWPVPNYENPVTQGLPLIIVNVIFMALISLALPLRLYSRYVTKGRLGWDDFNMTIAYVLLPYSENNVVLLTHTPIGLGYGPRYRCYPCQRTLPVESSFMGCRVHNVLLRITYSTFHQAAVHISWQLYSRFPHLFLLSPH
jgi:hypothetical protein